MVQSLKDNTFIIIIKRYLKRELTVQIKYKRKELRLRLTNGEAGGGVRDPNKKGTALT